MAKEKDSAKKEVRNKRPTPLKRDLQNERKRLHSKSFRARVLTAVRSLEAAISQKDEPAIKERLSAVYALMDKGVKTHVYKINKASRVKARLSQKAKVA